MSKENTTIFKTLLTKEEYDRLIEKFSDKSLQLLEKFSNTQTNYYFDTRRFTLKASDIGLRVKRRDKNVNILTLKKKKGYSIIEISETINDELFNEFLKDGVIPSLQIKNEIADTIKDQKIVSYLTLSTFRTSFRHKSGRVSIDKCEYVDVCDYELEFEVTNYDEGRRDFIEFVKENGVTYKKSAPKIKRAYDAFKTRGI